MNSLRAMKLPQPLSGISQFFTLKTAGIILLMIVLAIIAYYVFQKSLPSPSSFIPNQSNGESSGKEAELILFYADWCPHCKTAKPEWEKAKAEYNNNTINGYKILFVEIDCTNPDAKTTSILNKYNVEGYPTIIMVKNNEVITYDAKVTYDHLSEFLKTSL